VNDVPPPDWLPPMVQVNPWHSETCEQLYEVFRADFLQAQIKYRGFRVWFYPTTEEDGKEAIFWHLTTREQKPGQPPQRLPDLRRCERLSWIKPMILRCPCPSNSILDWDFVEGDGSIKTYIWLHRHDFVVILKKLPDGQRRLITSFHLDSEHQRDKMRKKWERRLR
jgi:hypothetical protein